MEKKISRIIDHRIENNEEIFLVQWKNSWVRESELKNCSNLLRKFTRKRRKMLMNKEYEVEKILDRRYTAEGIEEFLVKWKGYNESENSWEPRRNLMNCRLILFDFLERFNIGRQQLESILDQRVVEGEIYYLIQYKERENSPKSISDWIKRSDLVRCSTIISDYESERASKENPETPSNDNAESDDSPSE